MITVVCFSVVLVGCSQSEEDALKDAENNAEEAFNKENAPQPNYTGEDSFAFYLPESLKVVDEDASNVILEDEDHTYIVFYNNLEDPTSTLNFESAKDSEAVVYQSFKDEKKFGYIRIMSSGEEQYEIQIGVGGAKITTMTSKEDLDDQADMLMRIARSIAIEKK